MRTPYYLLESAGNSDCEYHPNSSETSMSPGFFSQTTAMAAAGPFPISAWATNGRVAFGSGMQPCPMSLPGKLKDLEHTFVRLARIDVDQL